MGIIGIRLLFRNVLPMEHGVKNLILNRLECAALDQRLRVERDTKALIHLYSEFDGHDGCQSRITQHRC